MTTNVIEPTATLLATAPIQPDPPAPPAPPDPPTGRRPASWRLPGMATRLWERAGLAVLLIGTGALYLINLSVSGWANEFYAAAVQAGSKSWKAFLFGSLDSANFITVDKPPASLWVMDLSARIFGFNSWSLLVPQALEGVAAVALLYFAVKRVAGPAAGLLAGAALAVTPIATLMFRFDNPDALLVLLMTAAGYATVRAIEKGSARWLALVGALIGFAFLTKMLQGLLVVPGFALAYLVAAPVGGWRRIRHLLLSAGSMIVAAGWWVAVVELWPAADRPYIGGSTNNNVLQLVFGYNGFGRLTGGDNNGTPVSNGGGGGGGFSSGETGWTRLFGSDMGSQISWLLPVALILGLGLLIWTARRPRTDRLRASVIVWGGWLLVTGVVFSFASGIIHPYYTVALAPAIAALVGIGVVTLWRADWLPGRFLLAAAAAAGTWWTIELLDRADWHPELRWIVAAAGAGAVVLILVRTVAAHRVLSLVAAPAIAIALLLAPLAYSLQTASTAHTGALPTAGPSSTGGFGGAGGGPGGFGGGQGGAGQNGGGFGGNRGGFPGGPGGSSTSGTGTSNGSGTTGTSGSTGSTGSGGGAPSLASGTGAEGATGGGLVSGSPTTGGTGQSAGGFGGGGQSAGGLGGAGSVSSALVTALQSGSYTWSAATTSSNEAATLELNSGTAVMALGGFNGTDPAITLAQFEALVKAGDVHYYIADGQGFIGSTAASTSTAYQIQQWVESHYTATTIGGTTVYDLTATASS